MKFLTFPPEEQEKVMVFLAGQHSLKITYDSFFQKIMSPTNHPERLESLLSELLGQPVQIERVLPREGVRLSYETSLIIMDILVQLSAFSSDKPADILKLINAYPEFRELHAEIAEFRKNPKELIV